MGWEARGADLGKSLLHVAALDYSSLASAEVLI